MTTALGERYLLVTLDTEVDKDPNWHISNPPAFRSVTHGVPAIFSPLFRSFGVRPTYLLSNEILDDDASCRALSELGDDVELGTHLHVEFAPPGRRLFLDNMGGRPADAIQVQESPEVEEAKLASLTGHFRERFGYAPLSFRSGRYGSSAATSPLLAKLGYQVDSSVTPGLLWNYAEGVLDYRRTPAGERWLDTPYGPLCELPISVMPGSPLAPWVRDLPHWPSRIARRILGARGQYLWLRPSWGSGGDLVRYVELSKERFLVMMLHSMEVIPGASPYARTKEQADRIISAMAHLFSYANRNGIRYCTMSEAARICQR
jgi:hypothetical protein